MVNVAKTAHATNNYKPYSAVSARYSSTGTASFLFVIVIREIIVKIIRKYIGLKKALQKFSN